ncbi:iron uptake porin [Umezakia ovalisporum]|uniref:Iron uptake porin n=2 Tax=Umezakia ovalisporum TaxID=75695 RepID=A0AA43GYZ3_9CYAN|nr:iron uptake porin [Umezakia ovalisporum]MDH6056990.1 iron uptake porin [Umezakia ovalisporum FSS-43]MDH6064444.1 iron uptake porin [Umezakia ovalisporum FSS-62]MDH6068440.1 iron uptake porin [Umezakia ovalisporum APH033B]MDH6071181.1 iron uptake porin [Umezakia ovalisporum CobakiLakeA]MDH6074787.1 iron uptake porin [Umezakia ovalisporum CS-1034]
MTKLLWNVLKLSPAIAATFFAANSALAIEVNEQVNSIAQLSQQANSIGQVTSVSQFSDVQPTDWAFQALQSLVERYGCIAGYPNSTYRGNRALSRFEFAAGLNACLDRVNELIATATADVITKEDLATLQRLQEEFSAELATLRGRVDALEARTGELEANQFSTTTKLKGEAIFALAGAFGDGKAGSGDLQDNIFFADRVRLSLESSFTGKDKLQVRLNTGNITQFDTATGTRMTRLGFAGDSGNSVAIDKVNYAFNLSDAVRVQIDARLAEVYENGVEVFNPDFRSSGGGALSRYGRFSPIYRQGAGGAGVTVLVNPKGALSLSAAYLAPNGANSPEDKNGIFDGNNAIFGQVAFKPSKAFNIGLTYARTYQRRGTVSLFDSTGSAFANRPFGNVATSSNNYGVQATFKPSSKLTVGGWAGYTTAESEISNADADIFYWGASLGIKDFGREGNLLGFIFGQPPKVTGGSVNSEPDTSYHLEGLYNVRLTDNIAITPGLLVILNPEHNDDNDTIYVGTLRTTFKF